MGRQAIPQPNCPREEWIWMVWGLWMRDEVVIISGWSEVVMIYWDEGVYYLIQNDQAGLFSTFFKRGPAKGVQHASHAALVTIIVCNIACCRSLYHFYFFNKVFLPRIPNCSTIFHLWTDIDLISRLFHFSIFSLYISFDKTECVGCFWGYCIYMMRPV